MTYVAQDRTHRPVVPSEALTPLNAGGSEVVGGSLGLGVDDGLEGEEDKEESGIISIYSQCH